MGKKQLASFAALLCCATPSLAFDTRDAGPSALFYVEFPLDGASRKQHVPSFGFSVQGREYRALNFDTRVLNALEAAGLGVEGKWVASGAAVLMLLARGKGGSSTQQAATQAPSSGPIPPGGTTPPGGTNPPGGGGTNPPGGGTCPCPTCGC
jgi:hypothetical protein